MSNVIAAKVNEIIDRLNAKVRRGETADDFHNDVNVIIERLDVLGQQAMEMRHLSNIVIWAAERVVAETDGSSKQLARLEDLRRTVEALKRLEDLRRRQARCSD